ncbi:MAG: HopJ type III effector protein [Motiliproteus sp.]
MTLDQLLAAVRAEKDIKFAQVMSAIEDNYDYQPVRFVNGEGELQQINEAGQNAGSCKLFAFARIHDLTEAQTLALFGAYYRQDVQGNPAGDDHQNIRNFMRTGWQGIKFDGLALTAK